MMGVCERCDDNATLTDYDGDLLCDECRDEMIWYREHEPGECDDPPTRFIMCDRDHAMEMRWDDEDRAYNWAKDEGML